MTSKSWQSICLVLSTFFLIGLSACDEDKEPDASPSSFVGPGMFICNEGPFQSGTGTLDYFSIEDRKFQENVFEKVNGFPLGNIAQSMLKVGDTIYIVINNANKIMVVDARDLRKIAVIEGLTLPRFMRNVSGSKAYVSCWDNSLAIINLKTLSVTGHITVGTGPEKMLLAGSKMLVLNQGGFSVDSTISIINTQTDQVEQTLSVYPKPTGIVMEKESGDIWVMCSGQGFDGWPMPGDSEGHLLKLKQGAIYEIEGDIAFPDNINHPVGLVENPWQNELLYLYKQGIYTQEENSSSLQALPLISRGIPYYSLGFFDRGSATSSYIVASDPVDYTQKGWVYLFRATDGQIADSVQAGVIPTDFLFEK